MERTPEFRIIGRAPEEEKEKVREQFRGLLFSHLEYLPPEAQELIRKFEYPKTKEEIAVINFANQETNRLRKKLGLESFDIPLENYHILPPEKYREIMGDPNAYAITAFNQQAIVFNAEAARDNLPYFGALALHETLHLKGHLTLEVEEGKEGEMGEGEKLPIVTLYRAGVSVRALQKDIVEGRYHEHFGGLHEAIIETQTKKSFQKLLELPELAEYKEWLISEEARKIKEQISQEREKLGESKIPEDEFIWVGNDGRSWATFSYPRHREVLDYVCREIQKEFPDKYESPESVFEEFLKAHFTGGLLTIGKLVEKTFGKGSFRMLGNMTTEETSAVLHLESLQKARQMQKKKT
jgi:hypothetical protein